MQIDPSEDSSSAYNMTSDDDEEVYRKKSRPLEISSYLRPGTIRAKFQYPREDITRRKFAALDGAFPGNNGAGGGNPLYQSDEEEA